MSVQNKSGMDRIREELSGVHGDAYWDRLQELATQDDLQGWLQKEYPSQAGRFLPDVQRRDFLRLMGGSLALAGLGACTRQPDEMILPYAASVEGLVPGKPLYYATAMPP